MIKWKGFIQGISFQWVIDIDREGSNVTVTVWRDDNLFYSYSGVIGVSGSLSTDKKTVYYKYFTDEMAGKINMLVDQHLKGL